MEGDGRTDVPEEKRQTVGDFGEFRLIDRIRGKAGALGAGEVGIGDDAAVVSLGTHALLTTDAFIEGVHFDFAIADPYQAGARMVTAAVSDVAAMGGTPRHVVMSLCAPPALPLIVFDALTDGILASCSSYGAALVGGDTVRTSGPLVVSLAVTGLPAARPLLRSGAHPGDVLAVTGRLGGSSAGLEALRDPKLLADFPDLAARHLGPRARVHEGELLASSGAVTSMIDVSDGLSSEVHHLARASGVGIEVDTDRIPLFDRVGEIAARLGRDPVEMALSSGEEFELLFTLRVPDPEEIGRLFEYIRAKTGTEVTGIGEALPAGRGVVRVDSRGGARPLEVRGFDHFRA
jgi:thiamine-monophosphate kinase